MSIDTEPMKREAQAIQSLLLDEAYNKVLDFNITAGTLPEKVGVADENLRAKLLNEEIAEYRQGMMRKDAVEVVDALVDILYVALGVYAMHGLKPDAESFNFNQVGGGVYVNDMAFGFKMADVMERIVVMYEIAPIHEKQHALDALLHLLNEAIAHHSVSKFWKYFDTIHQNNMTKFCETTSEAADTMAHYGSHKVATEMHIVGKYFVIKRDDGKVMKSVKYKSVDLKL